MDDVSPDRDEAISWLARLMDVPEDVLRIEPMVTPSERAELEAQFLRDVEDAYAEAARVVGPRLLREAGLDPECYKLHWEAWRDE